MHAAEGTLYRQVVLAAAQKCGWRAHAVELPFVPTAEYALTARLAGRPTHPGAGWEKTLPAPASPCWHKQPNPA
jgi:hypothetical protein